MCALLYVAVSFVLTGIVPYFDLNVSNPVSYVMQLVNQGWISGIISIGAIVGMTTVILVMIYAGTRLLFALIVMNFMEKRYASNAFLHGEI